ncbi:MAG: hypothetical protein DRP01_03250 [Archaeoglobales archaeon]|nr:MAG: hypothetical protein DRP01_03250 [Archaeoglobales archaeon]
MSDEYNPFLIEVSQEDLEWIADQLVSLDINTTSIEYNVIPLDQLDIEALMESASSVGGVTDPIGQLKEWLTDLLSSVADFIVSSITGVLSPAIDTVKSLVDSVLDTLKSFAEDVTSAFTDLINTIQQVVVDPILQALEWVSESFPKVVDAVTSVLETIADYIEKIPSMITSVVEDVISSISSSLQSLLDTITGLLSTVIDKISEIPSVISSAITEVVDTITTTLKGFYDTITSIMQSIIDSIQQLPDLLGAIIDTFSERITSAIELVSKSFTKIVDTIVSLVETLPSRFQEALTSIIDSIKKSLDDVVTSVIDSLRRVVDAVSTIPDYINKAMGGLAEWITKVVDTLTRFLENLPSLAMTTIENVQEWIWEHMPDWMKEFLEEAPKSLSQVAVTIQGFVNAIMKFPEWFPSWFQEYISKPIVQSITGFVSVTVDYVSKSIGTLNEVGKVVWSGLTEFTRYIVNVTGHGIKTFWDLLAGFVTTLSEFFGGIIEKYIVSPIRSLMEGEKQALEDLLKNYSIYGFINEMITGIMKHIVVIAVLKSVTRLLPKTKIDLAPMGVGGEAEVDVKETVKEIPDTIYDILKSVITGITIGMSFNLMAPLQWLTRPGSIQYFTPVFQALYGVEAFVEAPSVKESIDTVRRFLPLYLGYERWIAGVYTRREDFNKIYNYFKKIAELYGLPKQYIDIIFMDKDKYKLLFIDRFGVKREIPLGLLYEIPTHSEIARMTQKDIFPDIDTMVAVSSIRGMTSDVSKMIYLLTFKYPSFEKLWKFAMRSISGALWFKAPETAYNTFKSEAKKLIPDLPDQWLKHPIELNALEPSKARGIFTALNVYLKWLEYSNFPWITPKTTLQGVKVGEEIASTLGGWTADSWLMWDIASDIPGKIDARWMVKWGLFESLMTWNMIKGRSFMEALKNLPTIQQPTPIHMDLRPFCRLLQAHGLHPAWIPITAIAEAINSLTDERTLMRTGFIRLYKEGLWSLDTLEKLLQGFFEASFSIAYFDIETMKWNEAILKVPVMFLPGERRLLELRAVMDRAYDQFMEFYRAIIRAVRLHVLKSDNAISVIKEFIGSINKNYFITAIKELTGKELSMELDEGYINAWIDYAKVMVDLEARERTRYYARYIIWNIVSAVRTGYITLDDAKKWIKEFTDKIYEHDIIRDMLEFVIEFAYTRMVNEVKVNAVINLLRSRRITFNEAKKILIEHGIDETIVEDFIYSKVWFYTPSLTTYATLLEIVPEALETSISAIKVFNLPSDEEPYWITYVFRKPIQDELTLFRTRIYNALASGLTTSDVINVLKEYYFTFEVKDGKVVITGSETVKRLLRLYEANKKFFTSFGIAPHEWIMYNAIAYIEQLIDRAKERLKPYIPTPLTLASMSEVVPDVRKMFPDVVKHHNIPESWIPYWRKYIAFKPITDEIKRYVSIVSSMYEYFAIKHEDLVKALDRIKIFGYEKEELDVITYNANLERSLRAFRDLVGTPRELVTMAEYSPVARSFALAEVYKRIDSLPVDPETRDTIKKMWEEYIRIKPVYDEVRRYITELLSCYARGVITRQQLEQELEELKQWGLDDYEKQFYLWLAEKRKKRYQLTGEI